MFFIFLQTHRSLLSTSRGVSKECYNDIHIGSGYRHEFRCLPYVQCTTLGNLHEQVSETDDLEHSPAYIEYDWMIKPCMSQAIIGAPFLLQLVG